METHCAIPDGEFLHNSVHEGMPSWEANSSSASQNFLLILWRRKVQYSIHNSPHFYLSWARQI
jgi:hypothetical protein